MKFTKIMDRVFIISDRAGCCSNVIIGDEKALVFDTCCGIEDTHAAVREITDLPLLVINSHGHFDHIGGNSLFDKVYLHQSDMNLFTYHPPEKLGEWMRIMAGSDGSFAVEPGQFGNTVPLDFDLFDLGNLECRILPLTGHSFGSVGVYVPKLKLLLSGDALTPIMLLVFANHGTLEEQIGTVNRAMTLDIDGFLTSHHDKMFPKELLHRMARCLESVKTAKGYKYQYPKPPYADGTLYLDREAGETVAVVVDKSDISAYNPTWSSI